MLTRNLHPRLEFIWGAVPQKRFVCIYSFISLPQKSTAFFFSGDIWTSFQETNRKPHSPFPRLPQKRKIWKAISYDFSWASVKPRVSQTTGYYLFCPWFRIFSFDSVSLHYVLHWIKLHNYLTLTLGATQQETGQNNAPVVTLVRTTKDGSYVM